MSSSLKQRIDQIKAQRNAAAAAPAATAASPATPKASAPAPARKPANPAPAATTSAAPSPAPAKASAPLTPSRTKKTAAAAAAAAPASAQPAAAAAAAPAPPPSTPAAPAAAAPSKVPAKSKKPAQNAAPVEESNDAADSENIALASGFSRRSAAAARNKKAAAAAAVAAAAAAETAPEATSEQAQEGAAEQQHQTEEVAAAAAPEPAKKQRRKAYVAEVQEEEVAAAPEEAVAEDAAEEQEDEEEAPKRKARKPRKKSEGPTKGAIKRGKRKVNDTEKAIDDYVEYIAKLPADELPAYVSTFFEKCYNVKKATNDVNIGPEVSVSDHCALMAMALDDILDPETRGAKSVTKEAKNLFEPALEFARTGDYVEGSKRKLNGAYTKYSGQAAEANEYLNLLGDRTLQFNLRRNGNNRIIASPGVVASLNSVRMNVLPQYLEQLQTWGAECLTPEIRNQYTHRILSQNAWKTLGDVANQIQNNAARDANQGAMQDLQDLFLFVASGGSLADIDLEYSDRSTKKKAASTGNPNKRRKVE